ncbi:ERC protein 2 [Papilio machaon]|uniref:ERC protein 2 n=1 Tax=Papilio machaon TaxID=76193 RepID=A0A0N0PE16_PAPMA|nr:ERC protein 2 [Papilio machaon]
MHSIKTFWSPELKKERALRKEESAKYSLINDQLKLLNQENQVRHFMNTSAYYLIPFNLLITIYKFPFYSIL